ncbi:MAG: hypothetical protein V1914_04540 [archaeon]
MGDTVRERLERMMRNSVPINRIPMLQDRPKQVPDEQKPITPSKLMIQKIEASIKVIEDYNAKMLKDSECYLSLFYDRKKAEQAFLEVLKEAEEKEVSIPSPFMKRIEAIKSKIRDKPLV